MKWEKIKILRIKCRGFRDRDRIQTCNRLIRSQLLYSVELRDHCFCLTGAKIRPFLEFASFWGTFFANKLFDEPVIKQLPAECQPYIPLPSW